MKGPLCYNITATARKRVLNQEMMGHILSLLGEIGRRRCKLMYAVIETCGKQYKVQEGDVLFLEKLTATEGEAFVFDKVLAVSKDGALTTGNPVSGATVTAKVLGHGKGKKIIVFKYKAKKGERKKQGHRQPYTKVQIEKINA
jgi:large subunit ribosomal protein L21